MSKRRLADRSLSSIVCDEAMDSIFVSYERCRATLVPNFHTSSSLNRLPLSSSVSTTKSASAPCSRTPLIPSSRNILAGVAVTALRAWGILCPVHSRKLFTHSRSVTALQYMFQHVARGSLSCVLGAGIYADADSPSCDRL